MRGNLKKREKITISTYDVFMLQSDHIWERRQRRLIDNGIATHDLSPTQFR